jgi:hypothetical protein
MPDRVVQALAAIIHGGGVGPGNTAHPGISCLLGLFVSIFLYGIAKFLPGWYMEAVFF